MKFGLTQQTIDNIIAVLAQFPNVDKALMFGSRAKGNFRPDSDIDIAIKGKQIAFDDILKMNVLLEDKGIELKVDLIDYDAIKEPALVEHIDRVGIEFYRRWREVKISDLGKIITGNTPSSKNPEEFGDEMPFVTPTDYKNYNKWIDYADRYLSVKGIEKLKTRILPENSVLVTCIGSDMGKIAINRVPVVTNQQINSIIINDKVNPDFLYYKLIDSYDILRTYGEAGTAVPIVNKSDFENIKITITTNKKEQNAIASILSSLDDKIDLLHRQNKTLESLAETLFRQWFVEEAEESWEEKTLNSVIEFVVDNRGMTAPISDSGIPLIATNCIKNKNIFPVYEKVRYISIETYNTWFRAHPKAGDIIFVNKGTPGCVNLVPNPVDFCIAQDMIALRVNKNVMSNYFLFLYFRNTNTQSLIRNSSVGTTIPHLKKTDLLRFLIPTPDINKLNDFDKIVEPFFLQMNNNNTQIRTLTRTRDTLLPKLMSGEQRITL